mgnify:CR=1 FL=1
MAVTRLVKKGQPISFELFGDWDKALRTFSKLGPVVKESSLAAQLKVGKEIVKIVKGHLRNQDLGWAKLDAIYAKRKSAAGLSGKILMSYKTYYDNIKVWQPGNRSLVLIGVKKGIYTKQLNGKRSRLDVATIAAIHEFSSGKRLPRRQLWNPSITQMGGVPGIKKMFILSLVWHLRKAGIPVIHNNGNTLYIDGMKINPFK